MSRCSLLVVSCCWLVTPLWSETVYSYSAASASMGNTLGVVDKVFDASGPGFAINGGVDGGGVPAGFAVGQTIPLTISLPIAPAGGTVDFGGIVQNSSNINGTIQEVPNGSTTFVIPPNPNTTYTFAAQITGQFTVRPFPCGPFSPSPAPPCDASAVLSINLPGELTITLSKIGGPSSPYEVSEQFTSVPEPASLGLCLLTVCTVLFLQRRVVRRSAASL